MGLSGSRSGPCQCPRFGSLSLKEAHLVPRERVQNRTPEQVMIPLCLRSWRTACWSYHKSAFKIVRPEQTVGVPVPQIIEAVLPIPQERVQNRTLEQIFGFPCASDL